MPHNIRLIDLLATVKFDKESFSNLIDYAGKMEEDAKVYLWEKIHR